MDEKFFDDQICLGSEIALDLVGTAPDEGFSITGQYQGKGYGCIVVSVGAVSRGIAVIPIDKIQTVFLEKNPLYEGEVEE